MASHLSGTINHVIDFKKRGIVMNLSKYIALTGFVLCLGASSAMAQNPITATGNGAERILDGLSGLVNSVATGAGKGVTNVLDNVSGNRTNAQYSAPASQTAVLHHRHRHH